jgi:uncharacterized YceG family protein
VNGGYGAGGGRGSGGRGSGRGQGRPGRSDPSWQQGQPGGRPAQGGQPYGQRPGQAPGAGQGYGQGYDQEYGRPAPRPGSRPQPQYPGAGTGAGTGAQQYPRTGPQPGQQPGPRGTGPRPAQQAPRGYDPRGTAARRAVDGRPGAGYPGDGYQPRRAGDGYPADGYQPRGEARSDQEGYDGREPDLRDDSFMPGFGGRDDFEDERGPRRGRGGRYADDDRPGRARRGRDRERDGGHGRDDWDDTGDDTRGRERRPRRGPVRRLAPWIALLVILTPLAIGGYYVYHLYESKYHPADYAGAGTSPTVTVQVSSGDTATSLGPRLVQLGVVASSRAFVLAAEHSANTAGLEAGYYKLNRHMQASLAYAALLSPSNRVQLTVTIPEGKRVSQVIPLLAKATSIPAADFQQVINNPAQLGLPSYAKGKVEGYLFPATYQIQPNETALQILQAMVQRYNAEAQQINLASAAQKVGLTPEKVIIEASMAQAEGGVVSDYAKIARVIINRLNIGMKLQFDSVLLYGLNAYGINVTFKQIGTPGPYNDFQHAGLPPGPISNPGDAAIQGVLHPASGPWLYFLTTKTGGKSEFSATPLAGQ